MHSLSRGFDLTDTFDLTDFCWRSPLTIIIVNKLYCLYQFSLIVSITRQYGEADVNLWGAKPFELPQIGLGTGCPHNLKSKAATIITLE